MLALSNDVTLLRLGGHFPGSAGLHWKRGPRGATLLPGDAMQVVSDRRHVTFMYSYPNYMPMVAGDVRHMQSLLRGYAVDDVFGYTWSRNIIGGARAAVDASFERYLGTLAA
ncbi:hypothetical protein [Lysobacter fragariae]